MQDSILSTPILSLGYSLLQGFVCDSVLVRFVFDSTLSGRQLKIYQFYGGHAAPLEFSLQAVYRRIQKKTC